MVIGYRYHKKMYRYYFYNFGKLQVIFLFTYTILWILNNIHSSYNCLVFKYIKLRNWFLAFYVQTLYIYINSQKIYINKMSFSLIMIVHDLETRNCCIKNKCLWTSISFCCNCINIIDTKNILKLSWSYKKCWAIKFR